MKVNVIRSDIRNGERGRCSKCMIARAIKRENPKIKSVSVHPSTHHPSVYVDKEAFILPPEIALTARIWDEQGKTEPFSFTMSKEK